MEVQQIVDFFPKEQLVISRGDLATADSLCSILRLALTCGDRAVNSRESSVLMCLVAAGSPTLGNWIP